MKMHELGIVIEIVKTVEDFVEKNHLSRVDTLVLQIGKMAPVVPQYIEQCYPAAVDGTSMENTKLVIEILSGKEFMIKEIIAY
jgi:hydrogenase nickel incorporation protein HypA/HybF